MTGVAVRIEKLGPLFQKDAPRIVHLATSRTIATLIEMGESKLDQMLSPRPQGVFLSVGEAKRGQASKGHYRRNLNAVVDDLRGVISDGGVVYGPWLELGRSGTRFRGYSSFRRVGQELQKAAPEVARRHVATAVRELNGG